MTPVEKSERERVDAIYRAWLNSLDKAPTYPECWQAAFEAGRSAGLEEIDALKKELRVKQRLVHAGQYHQWNTFEICRHGECVRIKELTAGPSADKGDAK